MDKLTIKRDAIQVAVGIVVNAAKKILIAKRPQHWQGGGFWEFPGGKVEINEDIESALKRELLEEVGIQVKSCTHLISLKYSYPERDVFLNAWVITAFSGEAKGLEGQEISWQTPQSLNAIDMLPANRAIVIATQLPDVYCITPQYEDYSFFLRDLALILSNYPYKLLQFSAKMKSTSEYIHLAREVLSLCREKTVSLILSHTDFSVLDKIDADGIQLTAKQTSMLQKRPLPQDKWVGATCSHIDEILKAESIDADFLVVGPINTNFKKIQAMGWLKFKKLTTLANLPVYAFGGLQLEDRALAKSHEAHGIATYLNGKSGSS